MISSIAPFAEQLRRALEDEVPAMAVTRLLRETIAAEPPAGDESAPLLRAIAERLDAIEGRPERLAELASDTHALLLQAISGQEIGALHELVAERRRVTDVLEKYLEGSLSRTNYLGFVSEQRWPRDIRWRTTQLSDTELRRLKDALAALDIAAIRQLLLT